MDGVKRKHVKWILRSNERAPNYILVEETKNEDKRIKTGSYEKSDKVWGKYKEEGKKE